MFYAPTPPAILTGRVVRSDLPGTAARDLAGLRRDARGLELPREKQLRKRELSCVLRRFYPTGAWNGNVLTIGNVSFDRAAQPDAPFYQSGQRIKRAPIERIEPAMPRINRAADMRFIAFTGRRYSVKVRGHKVGLFDTREAARQARDAYLARR